MTFEAESSIHFDCGCITGWPGSYHTGRQGQRLLRSHYVVQPADWLAKIARYCGVITSALIAANPWTPVLLLHLPGQVLVIPGAYTPPPPPPPRIMAARLCVARTMICTVLLVCLPWRYTRKGIARYYGVSWQYLQYHNGIYKPNLIYPGQIIRP